MVQNTPQTESILEELISLLHIFIYFCILERKHTFPNKPPFIVITKDIFYIRV